MKRKNNEWGSVPVFQFPHCAGSEEHLLLTSPGLKTLLALYFTVQSVRHQRTGEPVQSNMSNAAIQDLTGLSKNTVTQALAELEAKSFISRQDEAQIRGKFTGASTTLLNPRTKTPLITTDRRSLVHANGLEYFVIPSPFVSEIEQSWSLAKMSNSSARLYLSMLKRARRKPEFWAERSEIVTFTGLDTKTFNRAVSELETKGLVQFLRQGSRLKVAICNPLTRQPLAGETDGVEFAQFKAPGNRYANFNLDAHKALQMLSAALDGETLIRDGEHEYKILCPFHDERTPSCAVNIDKQVFNCFGCSQSGTLSKLLRKLKGQDVTSLFYDAAGKRLERKDPDAGADAVYRYFDEQHLLVKVVLRYADAQKQKIFVQYRPGPGGHPQYDNVPTLLYRLPEVQRASLVCITEGEKDADSLAALELRDVEGSLIACTTSGGAQSWREEFADCLVGKQVVIIPDSDPAGARYAQDIVASLLARAIPHKVIDLTPYGVKDVTEYIESRLPTGKLAVLVGAEINAATFIEI